MPRKDRSFREDDVFRFWGRNLDDAEVAEGLVLNVLGPLALARQSSVITGLSLRRTIGNAMVLRYVGPDARLLTDIFLALVAILEDAIPEPPRLQRFLGRQSRRVFAKVQQRNPFFPRGIR